MYNLEDDINLITARQFAKIILARTHFECGDYEKAIDIINQLQFEKEYVSQGYGLVLFLQARAIKGKNTSLVHTTKRIINSTSFNSDLF